MVNKKKSLFLYSFVFSISLFMQNCSLSLGDAGNKQFQGLLGYFLSLNSILGTSSYYVTGTLKNGTGPIAGAKLSINFSIFGNLTRDPVDNQSVTGVDGFFGLKMSLGVFTINVQSSDGTDLGFFKLEIQSADSVLVTEKSPNLIVENLVIEKFIPYNCGECGDISVISSIGNRLFVVKNTEKSFIYESLDGINFTKYSVSFENCTNSFPSSVCKIVGIGFDTNTYAVLGTKEDCTVQSTTTMNPCQQTAQYVGIATTLENMVLKTTTINPTNTNIGFMREYPGGPINFYYKNGIIFLKSYSTFISRFQDGQWSDIDLVTISGGIVFPCNNLYEANDGILACGEKYYYDNTTNQWAANSITLNNSNIYATGYGLGRFYSILFPNPPNTPTTIGQFSIQYSQPGVSIKELSSLPNTYLIGSIGEMNMFYTPVISNKNTILSTALSFTMENGVFKISIPKVIQSSDGFTFIEKPFNAPFPSGTKIESPIGIVGFPGFYYLGVRVRSRNSNNGVTFPVLFRSTDGITWELVPPLN